MSQTSDPSLPPAIHGPLSIGDACSILAGWFKDCGLDDATESARILVCAAAGCNRTLILTAPATLISDGSLSLLNGFARRRLLREPVSRILGTREFWGLELEIKPGVLDPRGDTETLVEACVRWVNDQGLSKPKILDIGTGSGAVLCAVLSELPEARGVGLDISSDACVVAQNNIDRLGFSARATVQRTDIAKFEDSGFDVVLSNPPYVRSSEIASLDPEVQIYDPQTALDGGPDGLSFYRLIISRYYQWTAKSFLCAVEIGHDQGQAVKDMLSVIGVRGTIKKDLAGRDRIVFWES